MKGNFLTYITIIFSCVVFCMANTKFPFPQSINYPNAIKPTIVTQTQMNDFCQSLYEEYKQKYFTQSGCPESGMWRVKVQGQWGDNGSYYPNCTVSEAQGYGLLIAVIMDNSQNNTRTLYDGLYKYYKYYLNNNGLMKWIIDQDGNPVSNGAATDGDLDAAMSLILAHYQWGSDGEINYYQEAIKQLNSIFNYMIEGYDYVVRPGDLWGGSSITRPSDYITAYFKVFAEFTGENKWLNVVDKCYETLNYFYNNYNTALVPDFCKASGEPADMVIENTLSQNPPTDYIYGYNACRVPWRLGIDYLWFNDERSYNILNKLSGWIKLKTNNDVDNIKNGYTLDGTILSQWQSYCFIAPFGVASVVSENHQNWLNSIYSRLQGASMGYYDDSIRLLCLLLISGNFPNFAYLKPTVRFLNISNNFTISGYYPIKFSITGISDTDNVNLELYFNGEKLYSTNQKSGEFMLDTTQYEDGSYKIKIVGLVGQQIVDSLEVNINIQNIKSEKVYVENNPFVISKHGFCVFYNIPDGKEVQIYTIYGRLVRKIISSNKKAIWDGKDLNGNIVSEGIYIYTTDNTKSKIAVIR